jgi:hypothetical protein
VRCIPCEVAFQRAIIWHTLTFEKKLGVVALLGADMQKPYTPKCGQGKTKIEMFRFFFTRMSNL